MAEVVRRRDRRYRFILLGIFVAVFLFSFLSRSSKKIDNEVEAASLANFDPGYIISDYQMGRYNSMSEAEIQAFLTAKNPCGNRDQNYYQQLTASNPGVIWHFKDGHFICLSEEEFGDGEEIGSGETAAHIIWKAAQDYKINPQVLLVLLQKETSLITDPIPNNYDYRKATGYGCPDTAACSSEYYGFKNQVRHAAALFSTVLNGGWTNYPLGNNYIQFNPNAACGGSIVNIRSLATSALYRYTPYQPNEGALTAGYGTAYCGAYGNRNFYLYFEDWFSGIRDEEIQYEEVSSPRYMMVIKDTNYYNSRGKVVKKVKKGSYLKFTTKAQLANQKWCIRTEVDTINNTDACILRDDLTDPSYEEVESPRLMIVKKDSFFINSKTLEKIEKVNSGAVFMFSTKIFSNDGEWCIRTKDDTENNVDKCLLRSSMDNTENYQNSNVPRFMKTKRGTSYIVPHTLEMGESIEKGKVFNFTTKIVSKDGEWCIRTEEDSNKNNNICILRSDLVDAENYVRSEKPRRMKVKNNTTYIVPHTMETFGTIEAGTIFNFTTKIVSKDGEWCIRTEEDSNKNNNACILRRDLIDL